MKTLSTVTLSAVILSGVLLPATSESQEASPTIAHRQTRLSGQVTDPSSAMIPHATVHLNFSDGTLTRDTVTDSAGHFSFVLQPGTYAVTITAPGFNPFSKTVRLDGAPAYVAAQLAIATQQAEVQVAPPTDELNTSADENKNGLDLKGDELATLPVRIEREPAEDDPETGEELGRIDLKFLPAISAREEVYFAFECKRLNVIANGTRRTLAAEYVTQGMMRFVTGQYASSVGSGGMIGYVMDGNGNEAIQAVGQNIGARRAGLQMPAATGFGPSPLHPTNRLIRETSHMLAAQRTFRIHHVFLECSASQ